MWSSASKKNSGSSGTSASEELYLNGFAIEAVGGGSTPGTLIYGK